VSLPSIDPVLLCPIDELKIAPPTLELLKAENIYYIGDLVQRTETELMRMGFSSRAVVEIRVALRNRGLEPDGDDGPLAAATQTPRKPMSGGSSATVEDDEDR